MRSRWQHGSSSGELDVFGATSYFAAAAGLPDRCPGGDPAAGRLIQANKAMTHGGTRMEDMAFCGDPHRVPPDHEQLGSYGGEELHAQLGVAAKCSSSGKTSKLAALLSFMVSPSPRASFRKTSPPTASNNKQLAGGDEPATIKASSSSRELQEGCGGVHEVDLGVAMGDRRLQGVRVVRVGGDQQRWVVRCSAWDEEELHESSDYPKDRDDGDHGDWESDSSSDLFDLDLECLY
ncbi:hypothetical protein HU200_035023 [Digitaria exilis]|uniref:Uncharacterized protein n=1 Tax=Digitaria exilis TaxID=1010633 RepID=A0A835EPZ1_9POAL|nr:hypothetical protein HU200_035023 [Digitaria exilis]